MMDQLNRPLRDLRISLTDRCNFRCVYCMPKEIFGSPTHFMPSEDTMTVDEILTVVRALAPIGVHKVRLTGGEPLLRRDIAPLIEGLTHIAGIDDVALTTNGSLLSRERAQALREAGLSRITVSLDSLDSGRFGRINGVGFGADRVLRAIDHADEAGLRPIKINVVVKRGMNDEDVVPLAQHFRFSGHIVRFIEYMDVGNSNGWTRQEVVPAQEILERISRQWPLHAIDRAYYGEVATRYAYDDGGGEIGIIASVSQPFCRTCTRARLAADGRLFLCLYANHGLSLRDILRQGGTEADIRNAVAGLWHHRSDRYSELRGRGDRRSPHLEMFQMGG
ncbi:GTP 3',8-cyclase MoaA [Sulfobacillus sp. DSM 109850]|uniref:GTP 3',8-cyclase n=1 Tax=Sulfobacillus harzensis TaxID=2729629 RepID=A0A7Y0L619_9FIRM|nr:GTP 3',8-cyclase MoaA [Sulfobacillus harzensis]